jgi:hypothetical protein
MGLIPAQIPVQHQSWTPELDAYGDPVLDSHGNEVGALADPVERHVIALYTQGRITESPDVISADYARRVELNLEMMVEDSGIYSKLDRVIVNDWAYEVQQASWYNWSDGVPSFLKDYGKMTGGTVHLRKVT